MSAGRLMIEAAAENINTLETQSETAVVVAVEPMDMNWWTTWNCGSRENADILQLYEQLF
jgi:hypothetical protein